MLMENMGHERQGGDHFDFRHEKGEGKQQAIYPLFERICRKKETDTFIYIHHCIHRSEYGDFPDQAKTAGRNNR